MSNGMDQDYWDREIKTGQAIARIDANVEWLVREVKKQRLVLNGHDVRLNSLERQVAVIEARGGWWRGAVRFVLGIVGIKV